MSGWLARARALGHAVSASRGERWLARQDGREVAGFAELATVPQWLAWNDARQRRLATAAALLHYRSQIDGELRADVLAPLAALAGEPLFDAICDAEFAGAAADRELPPAARLGEVGEQLLAQSWRQDEAPDPYAVAIATTAAALVGREAA